MSAFQVAAIIRPRFASASPSIFTAQESNAQSRPRRFHVIRTSVFLSPHSFCRYSGRSRFHFSNFSKTLHFSTTRRQFRQYGETFCMAGSKSSNVEPSSSSAAALDALLMGPPPVAPSSPPPPVRSVSPRKSSARATSPRPSSPSNGAQPPSIPVPRPGKPDLRTGKVDVPVDRLRNFCIIAHIDHGKSTIADRLLQIVMATYLTASVAGTALKDIALLLLNELGASYLSSSLSGVISPTAGVILSPVMTLGVGLGFFLMTKSYNPLPVAGPFKAGDISFFSYSRLLMWISYTLLYVLNSIRFKRNGNAAAFKYSETELHPVLVVLSKGPLTPLKRLAVLGTCIVIAPAAEEIVYRGLVLDRLLKIIPPVLAVGVSSYLFGFAHELRLWIHQKHFLRQCREAVVIRSSLQLQCEAVESVVMNKSLRGIETAVNSAVKQGILEETFSVTRDDLPCSPENIYVRRRVVKKLNRDRSNEKEKVSLVWIPLSSATEKDFDNLKERLKTATEVENLMADRKRETASSTLWSSLIGSCRYIPLGIIFSVAYLLSGRGLVLPIVTHALYNLVVSFTWLNILRKSAKYA